MAVSDNDGSWCGYTWGQAVVLNQTFAADINAMNGSVSLGDKVLELYVRSTVRPYDSTACLLVRAFTDNGSSTEEYSGSCAEEDSSCFAGSGVVELASGGTIRMDALVVGDTVRVSGEAASPVFAFSHRALDADAVTVYVRLVTASTALDVTPAHYVYVDGRLVSAAAVRVGDRLEVVSRGIVGGSASRLEPVIRVEAREAPGGVYAPHTISGDIIVNGVRASTHTTAVAPGVAHALLAPLRAAFAVSGADVLGGACSMGRLEGGSPASYGGSSLRVRRRTKFSVECAALPPHAARVKTLVFSPRPGGPPHDPHLSGAAEQSELMIAQLNVFTVSFQPVWSRSSTQQPFPLRWTRVYRALLTPPPPFAPVASIVPSLPHFPRQPSPADTRCALTTSKNIPGASSASTSCSLAPFRPLSNSGGGMLASPTMTVSASAHPPRLATMATHETVTRRVGGVGGGMATVCG